MRLLEILMLLLLSTIACIQADRQSWQPPKKDQHRSPCPMLNALANHAMIHRNGFSIAMADVLKAMETDLKMPSLLSFLQAFYMTQFVDKLDFNFNLSSFHMFDHDVSLTRQDKALGGSDKPDPQLVEQLVSFAGAKGYLDYDDIARARRLRYAQSKASNPALKFGITQRSWAIFESILLMEVFGHEGKLKADIARDFFMHERLPLKWNPRGWDIGLYGWKFFRNYILLSVKTYLLDDQPPSHQDGHTSDEL
ncbi:Chloroperoxidase [Chytridium lagenaria]|nr:Chloroperoxidase [Chytridium lagenaria]